MQPKIWYVKKQAKCASKLYLLALLDAKNSKFLGKKERVHFLTGQYYLGLMGKSARGKQRALLAIERDGDARPMAICNGDDGEQTLLATGDGTVEDDGCGDEQPIASHVVAGPVAARPRSSWSQSGKSHYHGCARVTYRTDTGAWFATCPRKSHMKVRIGSATKAPTKCTKTCAFILGDGISERLEKKANMDVAQRNG
jgi:hypothetical protein